MQITLAVLADYANTTADGKLNIMGVFGTLHVGGFPARHPQMRLVFMIEGNYAERDRHQEIEINLQDPNGTTVFSLRGGFVLTGGMPGEPLYSRQILELTALPFGIEGVHNFNIFINGTLARQVPLRVILMENAPNQMMIGEGE